MPPVLHMLDVTPSAIKGGWGCSHVDTDHADETLVSISPLYLPLQLSDPGLQSLHGGGRGLLLCYPGEKRNSERCRWRDSFVHMLYFPDSIPLFTISVFTSTLQSPAYLTLQLTNYRLNLTVTRQLKCM